MVLQPGWGWAQWCLGLGQGLWAPPTPTGLCPTGGLSLVGPHGARCRWGEKYPPSCPQRGLGGVWRGRWLVRGWLGLGQEGGVGRRVWVIGVGEVCCKALGVPVNPLG